MKMFEAFILSEQPYVDSDLSSYKKDLHPAGSVGEKISTTRSGHDVHRQVNYGLTKYSAVKDGDSHMTVEGRTRGDEFHVRRTSGAQGGTIKAHELYHHLIDHHGLTMVSDDHHSPGGKKIWEKLGSMDGVRLTRRESPTSSHEDSIRTPFDDNYGGFNRLSVFVARRS